MTRKAAPSAAAPDAGNVRISPPTAEPGAPATNALTPNRPFSPLRKPGESP